MEWDAKIALPAHLCMGDIVDWKFYLEILGE
jgi:hypothetical protein